MITPKRALGDIGEEKAVQYLVSRGYSVVARNWATKFGEIDIVAKKKNDDLVFVEVKTVRVGANLRPEENLTFSKLRKLLRTVEMYCRNAHISPSTLWQVDAITVAIDSSGKAEIQHFENINIQ